MSVHTPGPWVVGKSHLRGSDSPNGASIRTQDGALIAWMSARADRSLDVKAANARLIAAAPELLEALQIAREFAAYAQAEPADLALIDAAIAKATGGAA